jgi:hypothetical protein
MDAKLSFLVLLVASLIAANIPAGKEKLVEIKIRHEAFKSCSRLPAAPPSSAPIP